MNPILQSKLTELENASDYECWYLVKQPTGFDNICYLVSFLKEYMSKETGNNIQTFISEKLELLKQVKPDVEISNNYRALRVAAFFGLITMRSSKYEESTITPAFEEINNRCNGEFEKTELYEDIIQRQIEKMFISSDVDEAHNGVRKEFRLYPVMLLYKVLLELGRSTGKYQISLTEYRYLVATTKTFEGFLDTLLWIKLLREDPEVENQFEIYRGKFDNRLNQALKQLNTLEFTRDTISIKSEKIDEVAQKVFVFEKNPDIFTADNYLGFLGSTQSLFELETNNKSVDETILSGNSTMEKGTNILFYGVPGSGKSHSVDQICSDKARMERVVFHPEYTYSDFVGQIMPQVADDGKSIEYKFVEGPFTRILQTAYKEENRDTMFYLVIEEINRGNAPAIFGDIFQLLDRDETGASKYGIKNVDVAKKVFGKENKLADVKIPNNVTILATMNTSDQNVFTLDTAFQRRWEMTQVTNQFKPDHEFADKPISDTSVTWRVFNETVNEIIVRKNPMAATEDKRLGTYFIKAQDLLVGSKNFPEKVIKYLWDDAVKFKRDIIFNDKDYPTLENVIEHFENSSMDDRLKIFAEGLFKLQKTNISANEVVNEEMEDKEN